MEYEQLPSLIKDNLTAEQWRQAQRSIVNDGTPVPETTDYINVKNGQIHGYNSGEPAQGDLLAVHDISGGHGRDSSQFESSPRGAHDRR